MSIYSLIDLSDFQGSLYYEQMILAVKGYEVWESPIPQIITGSQATYVYPKTKQAVQFSDCVETSFRNWFNIVLYNADAGILDIKRLVESADNDENIPLQLSDNLINFYQKYSNITNLQSSELYNAWTQVMEDLPGVKYVQPKMYSEQNRFYDINSSLPNMLKISNHLLFGNNPAFDQLSREEQIDLICTRLSRDDFALTWDVENTNITKEQLDQVDYVTLRFFINDDISFTWQLNKGHGVIPQQANREYPRAEMIAAQLMAVAEAQDILPVQLYTLMALFKPTDISANPNFVFLQSLRESENILNTIDQLMANVEYNPALYPVISQLIASLVSAEFDDSSAEKMVALIADNVTNTDPLYSVFRDVLEKIENPTVIEYLIPMIRNRQRTDLYDIAEKKFQGLTDEYSLGKLIAEDILPNAHSSGDLGSLTDIAREKFENITEDDLSIGIVIQSVLNNKFEAWYDIAKDKFEHMRSESSTDNEALRIVIVSILDEKMDEWYPIAKQQFERMTDASASANVINRLLYTEGLDASWYDIMQQQIADMVEGEPEIAWIDDVETTQYPLANVIKDIITHWGSSLEGYVWVDLARKKFASMKNRDAIIDVLKHAINWYPNQLPNPALPYDVMLQKAQEIGADDLVAELQALKK